MPEYGVTETLALATSDSITVIFVSPVNVTVLFPAFTTVTVCVCVAFLSFAEAITFTVYEPDLLKSKACELRVAYKCFI